MDGNGHGFWVGFVLIAVVVGGGDGGHVLIIQRMRGGVVVIGGQLRAPEGRWRRRLRCRAFGVSWQ